MTIDTAQLKFKSSNFTGSYLMSFSFRPQQGQHTKYPQHSRCVLLVYPSCDLPVLPEGTKDYNKLRIYELPLTSSSGPHYTAFFATLETPPSVILRSLYHPLLLHLGLCHGLNSHGSIDFQLLIHFKGPFSGKKWYKIPKKKSKRH